MLSSIYIENFRAFRELWIDDLGHVNLIVGKNNVGKSTLLEAVELYAASGSKKVLKSLMFGRDEPVPGVNSFDAEAAVFYTDGKNTANTLCVGPSKQSPKDLWLDSIQVVRRRDDNGKISEYETTGNEESGDTIPAVRVRVGESQRVVPYDSLDVRESYQYQSEVRLVRQDGITYSFSTGSRRMDSLDEPGPYSFVPPSGLDSAQLVRWWDSVTLTKDEDLVTDALRIVLPTIERISTVQRGSPLSRVFVAKVANRSNPLPLKSLGDGMTRLLTIALAIVTAQNGYALLDEIENGIHYSIQSDVWRMIFKLASTSNVQVFASSHSWDTVMGFQTASSESEIVGTLVRLDTLSHGVRATTFSEHELAIATRDQIEVR